MEDELGAPPIVDRGTFEDELDALRVREKAHTKEGDALAAARRRLPMVEVPASTPLIGEHGPVTLLDTFEGRRLLIAYYFMWHAGKPAPEQCEGCTWVTSQVRELSYIHARDATYAVFCQGPYEESRRYRDFMAGNCPGIRPWARLRLSSRTVTSTIGSSACSSRNRVQMRCAVCRCFPFTFRRSRSCTLSSLSAQYPIGSHLLSISESPQSSAWAYRRKLPAGCASAYPA